MTKCMCQKTKNEVNEWLEQLRKNPKDENLKEQIVLYYEKLVQSIARKYARTYTNYEDLVQVGMIGLIIALERFDQDYGTPFESYAIPTIVGEIKKYIRDKTWSVHVPRRAKEFGPKIDRAIDQLTISLQRAPTLQEVANHLEMSHEELVEIMEMTKNYRALSVDLKYSEDTEDKVITLLDMIETDESNYEKIDQKLLIESVLPVLSKRELKVLYYLYFLRLSQREIGEKLGISQMHVSRIKREALQKLRDKLREGTSFEPNDS